MKLNWISLKRELVKTKIGVYFSMIILLLFCNITCVCYYDLLVGYHKMVVRGTVPWRALSLKNLFKLSLNLSFSV